MITTKNFFAEFWFFNIKYDTIIDSAFIHHSINPPHLSRDTIEIGNYDEVQVYYSSKKEHLLPYPYETNCFDYRKNSNDFISKEDCIVKYFQRKEFDKCGCNRNWLYYDYRNIADVKICTNSDKCEFKLKYNELLMNKICSENCYNRYFDYRLDRVNKSGNPYALKKKTFSASKRLGNEILVTHLPKMNFVDYLCSIGGLFSMWFGISLFHLLLFIEEKLNYCVENYFRFNQLIIDLRIRLVQYIERIKLKKLFKLLIIILYSTAMLYQISDTIQSYLKFDKVTRFEINHKQFNPRILLLIPPVSEVFKFNKLKRIFPEIRRDNDYIEIMKINDIKERNDEITTIIFKYLEKLINELRFKEFLDITYGENIIKSCKVFKSKQSFNCSEPKYGIFKYNNKIVSLTFAITFENKTNSLYENNVCFAGSLDKIELELKETQSTTIFLGSCKSSLQNNEVILINKNKKTEIGFTSYTRKRLSIHKVKCLEENNQNLKNYSYENCVIDCFYRNLNQTYGCLPIVNYCLHLDFEMHFVSRGYRTCNKKINMTTEKSMIVECGDICLPECESVHYNTMVLTKQFDRKVGTSVEIFPVKFPHFIYSETLNMDFNQLIYNCGGILGLWFGLSPLSLDDLVTSLRSVRIKSIIFASIHLILLIAFKSKQMIIIFYVFLGRLLRSGYVHLKSIIKKLIDFILLIAFKSKQMIVIFYVFLSTTLRSIYVHLKSIINKLIDFILLIAFNLKQSIINFCKFLGRSLHSIFVHLKSIIYKLFVFILYMFIEMKRMITNLYLFLLMRRNNRIDIE